MQIYLTRKLRSCNLQRKVNRKFLQVNRKLQQVNRKLNRRIYQEVTRTKGVVGGCWDLWRTLVVTLVTQNSCQVQYIIMAI